MLMMFSPYKVISPTEIWIQMTEEPERDLETMSLMIFIAKPHTLKMTDVSNIYKYNTTMELYKVRLQLASVVLWHLVYRRLLERARMLSQQASSCTGEYK